MLNSSNRRAEDGVSIHSNPKTSDEMGLIFNRWPVEIEIWLLRKGNMVVSYDKGRRIIKKEKGHLTGEEYYLLKSNKIRLPAAYFADLTVTEKGKDRLYLWSPSPKHFFPMSLSDLRGLIEDADKLAKYAGQVNNKLEFIDSAGNPVMGADGLPKKLDIKSPSLFPRDVDIDNWVQNEYRRANELWQKRSDLAKWIPMIMLIVAAVGVSIIMVSVMNGMTAVSANFASASSSFLEAQKITADAMNSLASAISTLPNSGGQVVPPF